MVLLIWIIAIALFIALLIGAEALANFISLKTEQNKDKEMIEAIKKRYQNLSRNELEEIYAALDLICNAEDKYKNSIRRYGFDSDEATYATIDSIVGLDKMMKIKEKYGWNETGLYGYESTALGAFENRYVLAYMLYGKCKYRFHYK